jgi:hypothetical protein
MLSIRKILNRLSRLLTLAFFFFVQKLDAKKKRLEDSQSAKLLDTPPTESTAYSVPDYHKWADKNRN